MNIYAETRKGKYKEYGEDRIVIDDIILNNEYKVFENVSPKIIGVSDGVGGNAGGDLAAQFICEQAASLSPENLSQNAEDINGKLLRYASETKGKEEMAATFSAIVFGEAPKLFHIGNTRIYAVQGGYLKQITNDHTTYNLLRFRGLDEEAEKCNKSEIISCFGGGTGQLFFPEIEEISVPDKFVITSDGIHDHVDIDTMEEIICSEKSGQEKCELLIQTALDNGSYDDISVVLVWQ